MHKQSTPTSFNTQLIFEQWPDGLIAIDESGAIVLFNGVAEQLLAYTEKEVLGQTIHLLLCSSLAKHEHEAIDCSFYAQADNHFAYEENVAQEAWWITKDGHYFHMDFKRISIHQQQSKFTLFSFNDCSQLAHSQRELQRLALYAELNPSLIIEFDKDALMHYSNPAMIELIALYGYREDDPESISFDSIGGFPLILPANTKELIEQCLTDVKTIYNIETCINDRYFLWTFHPVLEGSSVQAYAIDISDRKRMEAKLSAEKQKFLVTLNSIMDSVITVDIDQNIDFVNPDAVRLSGCNINDVQGRPVADVIKIIHINAREKPENIVQKCLTEGQIISHKEQMLVLHKEGYVTTVKQIVAPMFDSNKKVVGAVIILHDVTETYQLEQKLSYQATHDQLTGLINRIEFEQRLDHVINIAYSDKVSHALLYLDLDDFKVINDSCGHLAGDQLLLQVTQKLKLKFRRGDILARIGGDEFGAILEGCSILMAQQIAQEICIEISHYNFNWESQEFNPAISIGVVPVNEESDSFDQVLNMADAACYAAKNLGRNRVHIYQPNDLDLIAKQGEMLWISRINKALKNDGFVLYFQVIQPIIHSGAQQTEGLHFEVLIRMLDDHGNIIPPDNFLPAAENYDLIGQIDLWVIKHVFKWLQEHQEIYEAISLCSINLSGKSIADPSFAHQVIWELEDKNIAASKICFEVTETAAIENLVLASQVIESLRDKGCRFSLDDFGSGMSSFGYLKQLSVDFLKIDGQFVKDILIDEIDEAMVKSINEIGHTMGLKTIAEYVENNEIYEKLKAMKIDYAQGYGIAKPQPLAKLAKKL